MSHPPDAREPRAAPEAALVLIVEDEEPLAETVAYMVRAAGYQPLVALHGRQAIELARSRWPALLIVDLMLPHQDGSVVIAALHADAAASGQAPPPSILMTAANLTRARAASADVVLRKPFRLEDLEALLLRFLGPPPRVENGMPTFGSHPESKGVDEPAT